MLLRDGALNLVQEVEKFEVGSIVAPVAVEHEDAIVKLDFPLLQLVWDVDIWGISPADNAVEVCAEHGTFSLITNKPTSIMHSHLDHIKPGRGSLTRPAPPTHGRFHSRACQLSHLPGSPPAPKIHPLQLELDHLHQEFGHISSSPPKYTLTKRDIPNDGFSEARMKISQLRYDHFACSWATPSHLLGSWFSRRRLLGTFTGALLACKRMHEEATEFIFRTTTFILDTHYDEYGKVSKPCFHRLVQILDDRSIWSQLFPWDRLQHLHMNVRTSGKSAGFLPHQSPPPGGISGNVWYGYERLLKHILALPALQTARFCVGSISSSSPWHKREEEAVMLKLFTPKNNAKVTVVLPYGDGKTGEEQDALDILEYRDQLSITVVRRWRLTWNVTSPLRILGPGFLWQTEGELWMIP
ncbi:hypothetical protein MKZ38_008915 [Zalerion maritima]|uniref:Uncharacterized protein n=1 Tax=Zalerion maritima TaxID=339359 RepID=A0AAD5RHJ8_9PEZI|nr:hypothetical protein MKZ38_008915 [Zalerion maritima]